MKVKLQPPSSTDLPAFNPILPPAAITQILLLSNPHKVRTGSPWQLWGFTRLMGFLFSFFLVFQEKVRLRYKLTFNLGDACHDESDDVDQFPPPTTWGSL